MDCERDRAWMHNWQAEGLVINAKINGVPQKRLVAYDMDKGWIERVRCDDFGQPIVEGGRLQTDILQGRVEVEWRIDP